MSGAQELKDLILCLDANRTTIGNAQYAFELPSESRSTLETFANGIHRVRSEAFRRIEHYYYESLFWHDSLAEVKDHLHLLAWASVYNLRCQGYKTEQLQNMAYGKMYTLRDTLLEELQTRSPGKARILSPEEIEQIKKWIIQCFTQELA